MTWFPSYAEPTDLGISDDRIEATVEEDEAWAAQCIADVPHRDVVLRSLLTLRLMTDEVTGGIVAAPTTSLPEDFGGERNWDYRYCWLRDAALTLEFPGARPATPRRPTSGGDWLLRTIAGDPGQMQVLYAVDGSRRLPEVTLDHLPGYADSRPVRIGNGAVDQTQHDVLGEVMDALEKVAAGRGDAARRGLAAAARAGRRHGRPVAGAGQRDLGDPRRAAGLHPLPGDDLGRAGPRGGAMEDYDLPGPLEEWRALRDEVRADVMEHGYDAERGSFTQHYGTTEVDASLLILPLVGFLDGDDPRVLGTIQAVEEDLMRDGLVLRYLTETGVDGLAGDEHPFVACSFWLVSAYAAAGRLEQAHALFDRLVGLLNDVGLVSEEYDPVRQRMAGNFPQAFSHLALVQAAFHLADADAQRLSAHTRGREPPRRPRRLVRTAGQG